MATMATPDREKALENALAQIERAHGKGSVMRLGDEVRSPIEVIPTGSIALDVALGIGGLPRGRIVEIYGPESSGKTTLALHAVANAQRAGGIAAFIDAEHALDPEYASKLGVDSDALLVSQPDTGEQALEIADTLIRSGAIDIIVIDSVAALVPRAEIEGEMGDSHVGLQARLMSQALRKITGALSNSGTTAIFINQLREKIGVFFGSPETTTGGKALKFYASIRIDVRRIETLKDGQEAVGNRTRAKVVKNKCLAEGSLVFDPVTGLTHRIEDIVDGRIAVSVVSAAKDNSLHIRPVVSWFDQGVQQVLGLRTEGGNTLRVTPDHKVFTDQGWVLAGDVKVGDRLARPRRFLGFGTAEPVTPDHARMRGELLGDESAEHADVATVPAYFFQPDTSADVVANLIFGLLESDGHVSKEQTGAIRVGFTTTSEQLAQQIHWLLLRFGIGTSVRHYDPTQKRGGLIKGRRISGKRPVYEVRISGIDNVAAFSEAIPMWGPRGQVLVAALTEEGVARHRGSQGNYLAGAVTKPVLAHLLGRVSAREAAALVGPTAGDPRGGMRQVLGMGRLRRDRVQALADALGDPFLHEVLADELRYSVIREVLPLQPMRTFDVEIDEFHTLVADDIVVHNCAPPFRQAEFDIIYNQGISREGSLIDMGVDNGIVRKSGAWYTYEGDQLGQGKENSRTFLKDNPDLADEIEKKIKEKLGIGPHVDVPIDLTVPVPIDL
jgi:protein RecA